jgi:hypothetical protein
MIRIPSLEIICRLQTYAILSILVPGYLPERVKLLADIRQEGACRGPCGDLHLSAVDGVLHKPCLKGVGGRRTGAGREDDLADRARSQGCGNGG